MSSGPDVLAHARFQAALEPGERLLLAALRAWANARVRGERPHQLIAAALAERACPRAASLFVAWIQAVEAASRRPILADCPHCDGTSSDLQSLVVACGLARTAFELGERLVEPLVTQPETVMLIAASLSQALEGSGWPLPSRAEAVRQRMAAGCKPH